MTPTSLAHVVSPYPSLALSCQRPGPGQGQLHLAATLGPHLAHHIAEQLLACALEDLQSWPGPKIIAPDHPQYQPWATALLPQALCCPQIADNPGQHLNQLDQKLRHSGHRQLIFIGSATPGLGAADYQRIRRALGVVDTVLILAREGGIVLIASRRPLPDLSALPWGTPQLGAALASAFRRAGHRLSFCGQSVIVEQEGDLDWALHVLARDPRPTRRQLWKTLKQLRNEQAAPLQTA